MKMVCSGRNMKGWWVPTTATAAVGEAASPMTSRSLPMADPRENLKSLSCGSRRCWNGDGARAAVRRDGDWVDGCDPSCGC